MSATIKIKFDSMTPDLQAKVARLKNTGPLALGIAEFLAQRAKRAFDEPGLRPAPWPARKFPGDGHPLLKEDGNLWKSIRATAAGQMAQIVSDRAYAAIHQFGVAKSWTIKPKNKKALGIPGLGAFKKVTIKGIPARPFVPIDSAGNVHSSANAAVMEVLKKRVDALLAAKSVLG
jgi:phage gpG-like protein